MKIQKNEAIEDYLKNIYEIEHSEGKVSTTSLARRLKIAPASVTGMIKKLSRLNLVTYEPYQGVRLTNAGKKIALEVIRHHRLIEKFLAEALGVTWDKVHEEAEKWEHVLSEELEDRIDDLLKSPKWDPHGSPIPARDGSMEMLSTIKLSEARAGQTVEICEVSDHDSALLRYLGELGLYPRKRIEVKAVEPFEGPIKFTIVGENEEKILGRAVAEHIRVTREIQ